MGNFKPGDEVVCVNDTDTTVVVKGQEYLVTGAYGRYVTLSGVLDGSKLPGMWASRFRKAQRLNDRLTIEAFLTIKPGFEEPRRPKAPAKKRERA